MATILDSEERSEEFHMLLEELMTTFVKVGGRILTLYEQDKKDGLPDDIIRKDIEDLEKYDSITLAVSKQDCGFTSMLQQT
jgi:hypothetical protein